jgi:hypothetical protein
MELSILRRPDLYLSKTGVSTSVRFLFAFFEVNESNGDVSPTIYLKAAWEGKRGKSFPPGRSRAVRTTDRTRLEVPSRQYGTHRCAKSGC